MELTITAPGARTPRHRGGCARRSCPGPGRDQLCLERPARQRARQPAGHGQPAGRGGTKRAAVLRRLMTDIVPPIQRPGLAGAIEDLVEPLPGAGSGRVARLNAPSFGGPPPRSTGRPRRRCSTWPTTPRRSRSGSASSRPWTARAGRPPRDRRRRGGSRSPGPTADGRGVTWACRYSGPGRRPVNGGTGQRLDGGAVVTVTVPLHSTVTGRWIGRPTPRVAGCFRPPGRLGRGERIRHSGDHGRIRGAI